jgi:hypothetical protein
VVLTRKKISAAFALLATLFIFAAMAFGASAASASVTKHVFTDYLAGYATTANGNTHVDDVRATVVLPSQAETGTTIPANTLVAGIAQQQSEVSASETFGIGWVWDDTGSTCGSNAWALAYTNGGVTSPPGVPVPPGSLTLAQQFDPVTLTFGDVCQTAGLSYLELQYDVTTHHLHFLAGVAWNNDTEIANVSVGYVPDLVAGAGLDSTHLSGATADLNTGTVAIFTSARVTTRHGHNLSLDALNVAQYEATQHGGAPSVANPSTLTVSGITGPRGRGTSSFTVSAP